MNQETTRGGDESSIRESLRSIAVGSYVFQCDIATKLGLNPTDLQAIHRLGLAPDGLTAGQLGEQLGLTSGAVTTAVGRLVARGYAERTTDENDARRRVIRVQRRATTDLGREYQTIDERIKRSLADLEPNDLNVVARFLAAIAKREPPAPSQ